MAREKPRPTWNRSRRGSVWPKCLRPVQPVRPDLAALEGKLDSVQKIQRQGCTLDITSYWVSTGQGGPWLMPEQMLKLGRLGISVWWDVY